jgi:hypothetical protein
MVFLKPDQALIMTFAEKILQKRGKNFVFHFFQLFLPPENTNQK